MDFDEQLEAYDQMMRDDEATREFEIRDLAVRVAEAHPAIGGTLLALPPLTSRCTSDYLSPVASVSYHEIRVRLHPAIQGPARVLIAEEIIRRTLGDKIT